MSSEGAFVWAVYIHIHPAGVDSYGLWECKESILGSSNWSLGCSFLWQWGWNYIFEVPSNWSHSTISCGKYKPPSSVHPLMGYKHTSGALKVKNTSWWILVYCTFLNLEPGCLWLSSREDAAFFLHTLTSRFGKNRVSSYGFSFLGFSFSTALIHSSSGRLLVERLPIFFSTLNQAIFH